MNYIDSLMSQSKPKSGLQSKFEQFSSNIELTQSQSNKIIGSHRNLREQILQPLDYVQESFLTGSYKRNTMIRPPNDVDIFVVLDRVNSSTSPQAVLNQLKKDLKGRYPNSHIRQDKPCIVLDFDRCRFELTPAICSFFSYQIPAQGANHWIQVEDPKLAEQRLSQANKRLNGKLTPLIKMMKACKKYNNIKNMKSIEIENHAIHRIYRMTDYRDGVQQLLQHLGWAVNGMRPYELALLNDHQFGELCRTSIFGPDFPG